MVIRHHRIGMEAFQAPGVVGLLLSAAHGQGEVRSVSLTASGWLIWFSASMMWICCLVESAFFANFYWVQKWGCVFWPLA